jgi:hypothetical protein
MIKKLGLALSAAMLISAAGGVAANATPLPGLVNQNFLDYTGSAPKGCFTCVDPVGWTGGSGLIYIDSQTPGGSAAGPVYLQTYGNPTGSVVGNYVEADGNPIYESGFNYTVTGLTVGQTYTLSFYQGASQQTGFVGTTTNQWIVSLGTTGLSDCIGCGVFNSTFGSNESTYSSSDPLASIAASPLMTVPTGSAVGWNYVTVSLKADATTDLLSFLAWGDDGTTNNLPPIAFLSGVDSPAGLGSKVPEPAVWAMMVLGFLGLGGLIRRERSKRLTQALQA